MKWSQCIWGAVGSILRGIFSNTFCNCLVFGHCILKPPLVADSAFLWPFYYHVPTRAVWLILCTPRGHVRHELHCTQSTNQLSLYFSNIFKCNIISQNIHHGVSSPRDCEWGMYTCDTVVARNCRGDFNVFYPEKLLVSNFVVLILLCY